MMFRRIASQISFFVFVGACAPTSGQAPPSQFKFERVFPDVYLTLPVWMEQPPHDPNLWYAIEQRGKIVMFDSTSRKSEALDITGRVDYGGEKGLLGFAFDPKFPATPHIYLNYTGENDGETVISRFVSKDGKTFDPKSETVLLRIAQPYGNHNGGQVSFGPDGFLYIGIGDGGSGGDPLGHGQNLDTLLGTIARIDVRVEKGYAIPKDNPFKNRKKGKETYAYGLRNPWRFSWDRKTKELWVGDVGQNAYEEISIVEKGKNYGWAKYEGKHCYAKPCTGSEKMVAPEIEYSQSNGDQSVTGGYVYRGSKLPALVGKYVFADFVSGRVWSYDRKNKKRELIAELGKPISSFVQSQDGELGVLDYTGGGVFHLKAR